MTQPADKPQILTGPYWYMPQGQMIFMKHPKMGDLRVLDVRSWGFLAGGGHCAEGLPPEEAAAEQDRFGHWVAAQMNAGMGHD